MVLLSRFPLWKRTAMNNNKKKTNERRKKSTWNLNRTPTTAALKPKRKLCEPQLCSPLHLRSACVREGTWSVYFDCQNPRYSFRFWVLLPSDRFSYSVPFSVLLNITNENEKERLTLKPKKEQQQQRMKPIHFKNKNKRKQEYYGAEFQGK